MFSLFQSHLIHRLKISPVSSSTVLKQSTPAFFSSISNTEKSPPLTLEESTLLTGQIDFLFQNIKKRPVPEYSQRIDKFMNERLSACSKLDISEILRKSVHVSRYEDNQTSLLKNHIKAIANRIDELSLEVDTPWTLSNMTHILYGITSLDANFDGVNHIISIVNNEVEKIMNNENEIEDKLKNKVVIKDDNKDDNKYKLKLNKNQKWKLAKKKKEAELKITNQVDYKINLQRKLEKYNMENGITAVEISRNKGENKAYKQKGNPIHSRDFSMMLLALKNRNYNDENVKQLLGNVHKIIEKATGNLKYKDY